MKANEAPEKLYIMFNHPYTVDYAKLNKRRNEEEVEYTRTDAFIEKACEWLKENFLFDEAGYCKTNVYSTEGMIYNFKKYIGGGKL